MRGTAIPAGLFCETPLSGGGRSKGMKKGDLTKKAIGLAVAGVFAGSRLASAINQAATTGTNDAKPVAGDEKKADDKKAASDKHVCAGKNSCKGKGGCASADAKHACKGMNSCKGMGGCKSGDAGCAGKNSCKGKGGCQVPVKKAA